ncbi:glycosyltransferase family 4 protein [Aeromonas caviae]|uniref:glycosyltransferase family 4 protein n=1 Tax=Aeromonas caviae TaxID=648 RepID=UPI003F749F8E
MKIIQIGPVTPEFGGTFVGGIATHLTQLVENISRNGFEIKILSTTKKNITRQGVTVIGMASPILRLKFIVNRPLAFIESMVIRGGKYSLVRSLYEYYIKSNYSHEESIIHIHSLHCDFADNILDDYNVIFTDHGFWQKKFDREIIRERVKKAKKIISVSKYAKARLINEFPEAEEKVEVIYNPITPVEKRDSNWKDSEQEKNIIFFNGYSESLKRKGLDLLIDKSVRKLKDERFEVVVDDEGRDYIAQQGKFNNLIVNDKLPFDKIIDIYKRTKLMVLPSRSESFGIVYIEAASFGIPVIGFKPVIEEFNEFLGIDIGLTFDPEKETSLELLKKIEEALSISWNHEKIKSVVERKFSWNEISKAFVDIYQSSCVKKNEI